MNQQTSRRAACISSSHLPLLVALSICLFHTPTLVQANPIPATYSVGFAERDITPDHKVTMGGYGVYFGTRAATRTNGVGVHDPLSVGAFAIKGDAQEGLVLVTADSVGLSARTLERIKQAMPDLTEQYTIVLSSTHTHSAPDTMGLWGALPFITGRDHRYMQFMEEQCIQAIRDAVENMQPATLSVAKGRHPNSTTIDPDVPDDDHFVTLFAYDQEGQMLGSLTQWSAHPTVLNQDNNAISADFPGIFRHYMQQHYGAQHFFFNGTLGKVYTQTSNGTLKDPYYAGDIDPHAIADYDRMAYRAFQLFETVSRQSQQPLFDDRVRFKRMEVLLPNKNRLFRLATWFGILERLPQRQRKMVSEVVWAAIGEIQLVTVPGEIFPTGALWMKDYLKQQGAEATMLLGISQNWLGYLMSPEDCADEDNRYFKSLAVTCDAVPILHESLATMLANP